MQEQSTIDKKYATASIIGLKIVSLTGIHKSSRHFKKLAKMRVRCVFHLLYVYAVCTLTFQSWRPPLPADS